MKKVISIILALLFIFTLFTGCGSQEKPQGTSLSNAEDKQIELSILSFMGEGTKKDTLKLLADNYMAAHSNVTISIQDLDMGSFMSVLQTRISAGDAPDLIMGSPMNCKYLIEADQILDISDVDFIKDMSASSLAGCTIDGKVYGLPIDIYVSGCFYNKDLFDQYHLTAPTTRTEYLNIIKTFEDAGMTPFVRPYKDANNVTCDWQTLINPLISQTGNTNYFYDLMYNGKKFVDSPESRKSFELFKEYLDCKSDDDIGTDSSVARQKFAAGQYPMMIDGSWCIGDVISSNPNINIGLFPVPVSDVPEENTLTIGTDDAFMVSKQSQNSDTAIDFLRYFNSEEGTNLWANGAVAITCVTPTVASSLPAVFNDVFALQDAGRTANADPFGWLEGECYDKFNMDIQLFAAMKDRDVQSFLEQLDTDFGHNG